MRTVTSTDGTPIAFEQAGHGPPIILVVGAFNTSATGAPLAAQLADRFTVFNYDRRGRGESGDTPSYAVEREIDDLEALITIAGGQAGVFGYSSGALLALMAAARGLLITKLAMYDPPFRIDTASVRQFQDQMEPLAELIASNQRGEAVECFQRSVLGMPDAVIAQMRQAPFWPGLEAIAPTLVYETTLLANLPRLAGHLPSIRLPTLVLSGGEVPGQMIQAAQAVAEALPNAEYRSLPGQTHDLNPTVLVPILEQFFTR